MAEIKCYVLHLDHEFGCGTMILTEKHCRLYPEPGDGTRLLVMRYWPRVGRRENFHAWIPDLAPSKALLNWCRANQNSDLPPEEVTRRWQSAYRKEMAAQEHLISGLRDRHLAGETITLLCSCHAPSECHRSVLADIILNPATSS